MTVFRRNAPGGMRKGFRRNAGALLLLYDIMQKGPPSAQHITGVRAIYLTHGNLHRFMHTQRTPRQTRQRRLRLVRHHRNAFRRICFGCLRGGRRQWRGYMALKPRKCPPRRSGQHCKTQQRKSWLNLSNARRGHGHGVIGSKKMCCAGGARASDVATRIMERSLVNGRETGSLLDNATVSVLRHPKMSQFGMFFDYCL